MPTQLTHAQSSNAIPQHKVIVIAENIHSPENVGAIFRIAEAMGVQKLYLTGITADLNNRKVKKTARDTHTRLLSEKFDSTTELIPKLKAEGFITLGLEITDQSQDLRNFVFEVENKYALFVGSERSGIQEDTLQLLDHTIHIPMFGKNSSMNVATALGVGLWEVVKSKG